MNSDSVGVRLRMARKGLGKSQEDMAAVCGVSREIWLTYERDAAQPEVAVLIKLALAGVDVNFVLTGKRSLVPPLSRDEEILLDGYRSSPAGARVAITAANDVTARTARGKLG